MNGYLSNLPGKLAVGAIAAAVAVVGILIATPAAVQTVSLRVVDSEGRPAVGARVCAGSVTARASRGAAITNQNGVADLRISQNETINGQVRRDPAPNLERIIVITASTKGRGVARAGGTVGVLELPETKGGPECPNDDSAVATLRNFEPRISGPLSREVVLTREAARQYEAARQAAADARAEAGRRVARLRELRAARDAAREEAKNTPRPKAQQERCFGAIGQGCGDDGRTSLCSGGNCEISAGSWTHDECCVENPGGALCGTSWFLNLDIPVPGQVCSGELALGAQRMATPWRWKRDVDYSKDNRTGIVNHADYCAVSGTFMSSDDAEYCCSRSLRDLNDNEWERFNDLHGWLSPHKYWAKVCR
ncbi:MAG: hypothetical protein O9253_00880 [Aquidulcibacter sp.]|jgi:hypothetical protein|nr:hypothetical protein [Aquidulcibacter sp.]